MQLDDDNIQMLCGAFGCDADVARRVLEKYNGDMDKAGTAILDGDTGEAIQSWPASSQQRTNTPDRGYYDTDPPAITIGPQLPAASQSAIDLTGQTDLSGTNFRPSERAPHPDWQVVPSNVAVGRETTPAISQEEQSLNDAIQRSLDDINTVEKDDFILKETVREGGRPVALRPEVPSLACAALVVQALYYVPQVRKVVSKLLLPDIPENCPIDHPARGMWNLIELFTNMDLAQLATLVDVEVLPSLEKSIEKECASDSPPDRAAALVTALCRSVEAHLSAQQEDHTDPAIFHTFQHVHVELHNRLPRKVGRPQSGTVVAIDHIGERPERDLLSCLSSMLSDYGETKSAHDVIVDPPEFIAFSLRRELSAKADKEGAFSFPNSFYLDRFVFRNIELTNSRVLRGHELSMEISELTNRRTLLSRLNQRDTVQDLKNTIYYYENVAQANDDPVRQRVISDTIVNLKDVLLMLESKIEGLDKEIKRLQAKVDHLFECPELKNFKYDLRAVLMHTGLPGRKNLYSYVKDAEGVWWKTCDHEVTKVTDDVVHADSTGIHLSAGPFMLLYGKYLPDEELRRPVAWPSIFANAVEENNRRFLSMLSPETAAKAKLRSPPPPPINLSPLPPRAATPLRSAQYPQPIRPNQMGPRGPAVVGHNRGGSSSRSFDASASSDSLAQRER